MAKIKKDNIIYVESKEEIRKKILELGFDGTFYDEGALLYIYNKQKEWAKLIWTYRSLHKNMSKEALEKYKAEMIKKMLDKIVVP